MLWLVHVNFNDANSYILPFFITCLYKQFLSYFALRNRYLDNLRFYMNFINYISIRGLFAMPIDTTTKRLEVWSFQSSRTRKNIYQFSFFTVDRDRTVSRRSKPSSRTTFVGEQPNPWNPLQHQDVMSRHRGAKPLRRYVLSRGISLLSPAYFLFVERQSFHAVLPDHYDLPIKAYNSPYIHLRYLNVTCQSTSQDKHQPLRSLKCFQHFGTVLCTPPLLFRRKPPQSNYQLQICQRFH